jgi:hypothetical protein
MRVQIPPPPPTRSFLLIIKISNNTKREIHEMKKIFLLAAIIVMLGAMTFAQDKMTADDVVAKHLASIGKPEDIAAAKTLIFNGDAALSSALNSSQVLQGQSQFGSQGNMMVWAAVFNSNDHPYDKIAFDGKNQTIALPNGKATVLTSFFKAQSAMTKYGIFGGVLSTGWGLYDTKGRKIKLDFGGLVKIEGKELYKLKFSPGNDFRVALYFETDTFHHVMTEYEYSIEAGMNSSDPTQASQSKRSNFKMVEKFSDFKTEKNLTYPRDYLIQLDAIDSNSGKGTKSLFWHMTYREVFFNEPFQEGTFKVG